MIDSRTNTLAEQIELACVMEATARKPGNVHPAASFNDLCYEDFVRVAKAACQPISDAKAIGIGRAAHDAIVASHNVARTNVNLGIVLLMTPLAAVPVDIPLEIGIGGILDGMTISDAELVYSAIRLASPGGLAKVSNQDIQDKPTVNLRDAMSLAADRDRIAEQYLNGFQLVFAARDKLCELLHAGHHWESAIIFLQIWILSNWSDTLIARKCGKAIASEASTMAASLISRSGPDGIIDKFELCRFDEWLRSDGHRRNPGTTADLIAATLFVALREERIFAPTLKSVLEYASQMRISSNETPEKF